MRSFRLRRSQLVCDFGGDERATLLVAGSGRSGTTWVGDVIAKMTRSRVIVEPFMLDTSCEIADQGRSALGEGVQHNYSLYVPQDAGVTSYHYPSIGRVLHGHIRNEWWDQGTRPGIYLRRLIKEIRANLLLGYLSRTWPKLKIIWLVRDPFSVVESQLAMVRRRGWAFDLDLQSILSQERLVDDWLGRYIAALQETGTIAERLAHRWCIETMVPFWQGVHDRSNVRLVRYEDLARDMSAWDSIAEFVSGTHWSGAKFAKAMSQLATTSREHASVARTQGKASGELGPDDIRAIQRIVTIYGAGHFTRRTPRSASIEAA
jgi:hypothetical protein